jgi:hypothetical protein
MHIQEPAHRSGGLRGPNLKYAATLLPFNEYSTANAALILEAAASTVECRDGGVRKTHVVLAKVHLTPDWMRN